MPLKLIWNATASAPIGFYTVEPADALDAPELVAVMPPEPLADFMVERGYIARGVPLLKRVLGLPGQRVCRAGRTITVNGIEMGEALDAFAIDWSLCMYCGICIEECPFDALEWAGDHVPASPTRTGLVQQREQLRTAGLDPSGSASPAEAESGA